MWKLKKPENPKKFFLRVLLGLAGFIIPFIVIIYALLILFPELK